MTLEVLGWAMLVLSTVGLIRLGYDHSSDLVAYAILAGLFLGGVVQIGGAQITRAVVATAEDSERTVKLLEKIYQKMPVQERDGDRIEPTLTASPVLRAGK